ncbi:ankyrin repeat-containing domain protein [Aspergillus varians]
MAEALGLVANIAAVLQLASEVAQLSYKYARDVKNAPRTQKQYLQEVSALMDILFRVEQAVQDAETTGLLPNRPSSLSADSVMDCYKALSGLYFDLQKRRPRLLQPFHEREWRVHIDMLTKYRSLFVDFLSSCVLTTGTATYNKVASLKTEQDRSLLLTWLPAPNLSARRRPSPCPGTGSWFLEEDSVQKWIEKALNFVWCYGAPGVGKSFLASRVIDHLLDAQVSQGSLVINFFCDFPSQDEQKAVDILHHLLRQIIEQGNAEVLTILKESCKDPSKLQSATEVAELIASAGLTKPIYLILDAVDEMKDPIPLLSQIKSLVSAGVNVLITSRDLPHIRKNMTLARMLKVRSNPKDLKLYIESRLRDSDFSEEIDEEGKLVGDILSNSGNLFLLSRLILDNVLDLTTVNQIRKALQKPHASLHQAFKATMGRIESQSKARNSLAHRLLRWMTHAKRRLRLQEVLCAFSVEDEELDPDNKPHPDILLRVCHGLVVVDDVDGTVGLVHTTAYEFLESIKDLGPEGDLDIARTSLQYLAMKHTSNPCATSGEMLRRLQSLEFFEYSAKYWGRHISTPDQERQLEGLITKLLSDDRKRNSVFQALQYQLEFADSSSGEDVLQSMPTNLGALHVAAYWGLAHTARSFLAKGESVCGLDSHKWTPLHWACCQSHPGVVKLLITVGADVNAQDIQGWTPLFWAAFKGDAHLVRLLLSHGANHLLRSTLGWTALHWAVSSGHSETVEIFLEHHARSEIQEATLFQMSMESVITYAEGIRPVQVAAEGQDLEIFNLLVRHLQTPGGVIGDAKFNMIWDSAKFDSPASSNPWRTMTKGERINGRERTLPTLTGSYADNSERYRTDPTEWKTVLLVSAVRDGQLASVRLLAKAGANVNSALYAAACRRDPSYVRCLLANGADPNKRSYGKFPLHEAVLNGFLETTAALIDGGADVNQAAPPRDSDDDMGPGRRFRRLAQGGATPLIQACGFLFGSKGPDLSLEMGLLLLSHGADPGLRDASGMTALHYAAMRPHLPLIKLLVSSGGPVDVRDEKGRLPIHCLGDSTGSPSHKTREYQMYTSNMPEVVRIFLDAARRGAFPHMLDVPVRRGPTAVDDDRTVPSGKELEGLTPMGIALATKRWEIVVVFHALGAQPPLNMDLEPIVVAAIADLAVDAVDILLGYGAHIATNAIHTLLGALLARRSDGESVDPAQ